MSRSILLAVAAILLALTTTGCLRSATTVLVHDDGSATITDTTLFSPRFLAMMASLDKGFGGEGASDQQEEPSKPWSDSTLKADAADFGPNVELDSWEEVTIDGMQGYVAVYEAESVNDLVLDGDRGTDKVKTGDEAGEGEAEDDQPSDPVATILCQRRPDDQQSS